MSRPNFFIIGGPKCGTTALDAYLGAHEGIFMCTPKDTNYFSGDLPGMRRVESERAYLDLFSDASEGAIGESSSLYMYSREAVPAILDFAPEARLIAMVRNPIALVESFHSQLLYSMEEDVEDCEAAWRLQAARARGEHVPPKGVCPEQLQYREVAMLGAQLQRVYELVPRDRVKVVVFDDLADDTAAVYREVLSFLGVADDGRTEFPKVNTRKEHRSAAVGQFTEQPPALLRTIVAEAKRVLGVKEFGLLNRVRAVNDRAMVAPGLSPAFRAELSDTFRDDVNLLGELIGRRLDHWLGAA